jgi:DNA repair protein RecN (Recombination protein N)
MRPRGLHSHSPPNGRCCPFATAVAALKLTPDEWATLSQAQTRLAHAASLLETAAAGEDELAESDDALTRRLSTLITRLQSGAAHDPALLEIVDLLQPARIQLDEAARSLRGIGKSST